MRHVIEIISSANTPTEMAEQRAWYSRYGVEEYLVFHPETGLLEVFIRTPLGLSSIDTDLPWTSTVLEGCAYRVDPAPHLGDSIFDLVLLDPGGTKVETLDDAAARADEQAAIAVAETARADALAAQLRAAGIEPEA